MLRKLYFEKCIYNNLVTYSKYFKCFYSWLTKDFHSEGRLSIGSTGHKNMFIGLGFGGSSLDAKGGIVGGTIELSKIDTFSKWMHL